MWRLTIMYTLVIADDEKNICDGIAITLTSACPEIEIRSVFYDSEDLLHYLQNEQPDILVCDIQMGDISGLDIAKYIDEQQFNTHIILITGYRLFEYAHQAIRYHVDTFLTKPYSSGELISAVKKIEQDIDTRKSQSRRLFHELLKLLTDNRQQDWENLLELTLSSISERELSSLFVYAVTTYNAAVPYPEPGRRETIKHILFSILQPDSSKTDSLVQKAIAFIKDNYADVNLSRDMIADKLAVNPSHLSRAFSSTTGQGLTAFILKTRMDMAKTLLTGSALSTSDIAGAVGYNDPSYFKRSFKSYTGVTPAKFRSIKGTNYE